MDAGSLLNLLRTQNAAEIARRFNAADPAPGPAGNPIAPPPDGGAIGPTSGSRPAVGPGSAAGPAAGPPAAPPVPHPSGPADVSGGWIASTGLGSDLPPAPRAPSPAPARAVPLAAELVWPTGHPVPPSASVASRPMTPVPAIALATDVAVPDADLAHAPPLALGRTGPGHVASAASAAGLPSPRAGAPVESLPPAAPVAGPTVAADVPPGTPVAERTGSATPRGATPVSRDVAAKPAPGAPPSGQTPAAAPVLSAPSAAGEVLVPAAGPADARRDAPGPTATVTKGTSETPVPTQRVALGSAPDPLPASPAMPGRRPTLGPSEARGERPAAMAPAASVPSAAAAVTGPLGLAGLVEAALAVPGLPWGGPSAAAASAVIFNAAMIPGWPFASAFARDGLAVAAPPIPDADMTPEEMAEYLARLHAGLDRLLAMRRRLVSLADSIADGAEEAATGFLAALLGALEAVIQGLRASLDQIAEESALLAERAAGDGARGRHRLRV